MDLTRSQSAPAGTKAVTAVLPQESGVRRMQPSAAPSPSAETVRKPAGYGLPCSKCRLYYPADLDICPTCHGKERVSPVTPKSSPVAASVTAETPSVPDAAVIEQGRALIQGDARCIDCHQFRKKDEDATAPDLTGYGSA